ncbi:probable carboxylesterase 2 isoform X1 [Impatiens glandulifera]|uniref:probable carboxylesterase 2 isoform X1 n=1 Tax=Impatiens glandulifera TaxID=253017 RepID=UPI001FB188CA|nr:probable carboxylesterase 2 isoform X1 [Impatiens glandulifera]
MADQDIRNNEIVHEIKGMIRIYKDGSVERFMGCEFVPPSIDPQTGVQSKDVVISPENSISARLYIPKSQPDPSKLPLLIYFHGGAFCIETAFSPMYHNYLNSLVSAANIVAISVDYRRAPENPLPAAFEDSWESVKWAVSAEDEWVKNFADLKRVFFAGDSAGGNIAYRMGIQVGLEGLSFGAKLMGVIIVQPYFGGEEVIGSEATNPNMENLEKLWRIACPTVTSLDDPMINPSMDPNIGKMGCERVLVCAAEKECLNERVWCFYEALKRSNWKGKAEIVETAGEDHIFHLYNPTGHNALALMKLLVSFINESI